MGGGGGGGAACYRFCLQRGAFTAIIADIITANGVTGFTIVLVTSMYWYRPSKIQNFNI